MLQGLLKLGSGSIDQLSVLAVLAVLADILREMAHMMQEEPQYVEKIRPLAPVPKMHQAPTKVDVMMAPPRERNKNLLSQSLQNLVQ
jgi:hypothetical protein